MNSRSIVKSALLTALLLLIPCMVWGNYADSTNVTVDTRTLTMTQLVITGPTSVPNGQDTPYTATLNYQGTAPEDVTNQCEWMVNGGPMAESLWEVVGMDGNVLKPKVASTIPLLVSAKITRNNGKIASNTLSVIVTKGTGLYVGIGVPVGGGPNYVSKSGTDFVWNYAAYARGLAVTEPGVTVTWYLNGAQIATGASFNQNLTGPTGTKELKVIATDLQGRTGQSIAHIPFNVPPSANEPDLVQAQDPGFGEMVDEDGNPFQFNPVKTPKGLIVVTHGLYGESSDKWLLHMAKGIRIRLASEGKPLPNIAVYGWGALSTPSTSYWGIRIPVANVATDILLIRPRGFLQGVELADWFKDEMGRGNISGTAPVHLIGHSAGGFVVGECAYQLGGQLSNVRVTMLDTPIPLAGHLNNLPGPGMFVDKYVSSYFGALENPLTLTAGLSGNGYYRRIVLSNFLPLAGDWVPTYAAHSYSHEWYDNSVWVGDAGAQGFGWSPFLSSNSAAALLAPTSSISSELKSAQMLPAPAPMSMLQTDSIVTGFTSFGLVSAITVGYQITEGNQANSGIMLGNYAMPVGAQSLSFRFQFTGAGDGDFLVVSHGETPIGYGSDNNTSESGEVTVNMPVEHLAGQQGDLVFRLMSRGNQNAVITLKGITLTTVDDADLDGLTNTQEATSGTNPLLADTDGDGIDDPTELNITLTNPVLADSDGDGANDGSESAAGTNPLDGSSRFAVKSSVKAGSNFTVTWSSVAAKQYRILRSPEPDFGTYDVIASEVAAAPPVQSFTDTGGATGSRMFFRVELEP